MEEKKLPEHLTGMAAEIGGLNGPAPDKGRWNVEAGYVGKPGPNVVKNVLRPVPPPPPPEKK